MALSVDTLHTDGTRMACSSEYNGPGTTGLRIVSPTNPAPYALDHSPHKFIIVCPVKPDDDTTFGDGLDVLVNFDVHNQLNASIVAWETNGVEPYVADHPTDADQRYESFVVQLRDWLLSDVGSGSEKVWLVSFSKGGWSVLNLLLRHPDKFAFASLFDPIVTKAQIQADSGIGSDFSGCAIGSEANYDANYDLVTNIDAHKAAFVGGNPRIWIAEGPAFGSPGHASNWTTLKNALNAAGIPYWVREDYWQGAAHHWDTYEAGVRCGWCPVAADAGYQAELLAGLGTLDAVGADVVDDYNVLIPFAEGSGDVGTQGSDSVPAETLTGDAHWDTHEYSGQPVVRVEGTAFLDFGFYTGLGTGDKTVAVLAKMNITAGGGQYGALVDNEHDQGWSFFVDFNANGRLQWYASNGVFGGDTGPAVLFPGVWRLLVATWDAAANDVRFYVNGALNSIVNLPSAAEGASNGPLVVNAIRSGTLFKSQSHYKQIRLYDRRLSDAEVRQLFGAFLTASAKPWLYRSHTHAEAVAC